MDKLKKDVSYLVNFLAKEIQGDNYISDPWLRGRKSAFEACHKWLADILEDNKRKEDSLPDGKRLRI